MRYLAAYTLVLCFVISRVDATCVLESEFGFTLNCAFKKSGLFRVRNLGGIKAHAGFGFSVGDELGFKESLSNVEGNKRRSVSVRAGANSAGVNDAGVGVLPAPKAPGSGTKRAHALTVRQPQSMAPQAKQFQHMQYSPSEVQQNVMAVPAFKPIPPAEDRMVLTTKPTVMMVQRPLHMTLLNYTRPLQMASVAPNLVKPVPAMAGTISVPAFQAMPSSVSRISTGPTVYVDNTLDKTRVKNSIIPQQYQHHALVIKAPYMNPSQQIVTPSTVLGQNMQSYQTNNQRIGQHLPNMVNFSDMIKNVQQITTKQKVAPMMEPASNTLLPTLEIKSTILNNDKLMGHSIKELASASNITVEAIEAAILLRQQQLLQQHGPQQAALVAHTTTTTTHRPAPTKKYPLANSNKVMNAPKEYYPVGYDKNFDDNFASRVELPETSFNCGDQKHFPGLYADEDLGCMVFHVCALTDDGLIMKSFLCPESTLFDQTVLKCNWWFYVECKNSKNLYDSNIPISKSYQLMKALTFFSSYKKDKSQPQGESNQVTEKTDS